MRRSRTIDPPLFNIMRPGFRHWKWSVHLEISSAGYCTSVSVIAVHPDTERPLVGQAVAPIILGDDVRVAMEDLAIEACLAAIEPPLTGMERLPRRLSGPFPPRD